MVFNFTLTEALLIANQFLALVDTFWVLIFATADIRILSKTVKIVNDFYDGKRIR